jgi:hypothetical protein
MQLHLLLVTVNCSTAACCTPLQPFQQTNQRDKKLATIQAFQKLPTAQLHAS